MKVTTLLQSPLHYGVTVELTQYWRCVDNWFKPSVKFHIRRVGFNHKMHEVIM